MNVIPDAPRVSEQGFPPNFSWEILPAKFHEAQIKVSHSELNLSSNNDEEVGMKQSNSAFEILSMNEANTEQIESELVDEDEMKKLEIETLERPQT